MISSDVQSALVWADYMHAECYVNAAEGLVTDWKSRPLKSFRHQIHFLYRVRSSPARGKRLSDEHSFDEVNIRFTFERGGRSERLHSIGALELRV